MRKENSSAKSHMETDLEYVSLLCSEIDFEQNYSLIC